MPNNHGQCHSNSWSYHLSLHIFLILSRTVILVVEGYSICLMSQTATPTLLMQDKYAINFTYFLIKHIHTKGAVSLAQAFVTIITLKTNILHWTIIQSQKTQKICFPSLEGINLTSKGSIVSQFLNAMLMDAKIAKQTGGISWHTYICVVWVVYTIWPMFLLLRCFIFLTWFA